jgi:hypothetical protein
VKQLKVFVRLRHRELGLLLQAFIALAVCRARLRAWNVRKLQAWATRAGNGTITVDRLTWAVEVASRKMTGVTCLCRALALQRLLARNGHGSELKIGVEKNDDQFGAHAWLLHDDQVLIGASQLGKYELLSAWQARTAPTESGQTGAARL